MHMRTLLEEIGVSYYDTKSCKDLDKMNENFEKSILETFFMMLFMLSRRRELNYTHPIEGKEMRFK
jgi:hypothetical protein